MRNELRRFRTTSRIAGTVALITVLTTGVLAQRGGNPATGPTPAAGRSDVPVYVLPVRGNVYMLVAGGSNVTASIGRDGIFLVDTGSADMTDKVLSTVLELATRLTASGVPATCMGLHCAGWPGWVSPSINAIISSPAAPKPIRYIVQTSMDPDHTGGTAKLAQQLAQAAADSKIVGVTFPPVSLAPQAIVYAHENVLIRMSQPEAGKKPAPEGAWPTDTYHGRYFKLSQFFNGEGVQIFHAPAAHTDGDSFVYFRYSDVIAAGDLLNTTSYPVIDLARGGTIQGVLDGLNHILEIAIPEFRSQGGTMVIPGHGRLCDTGDVANYRNMVAIIRDRIQALINKGMTIEQVKAARPTLDYDGLYGSRTGPWTTDMFIEATYASLRKK
jgi:glyoxylase-like metal-dependent hydrolase (beta-lactamase superfamily II)